MDRCYRIREAAKKLGITVKQLRDGERAGVFPIAARLRNGYRIYDEDDIQRLATILGRVKKHERRKRSRTPESVEKELQILAQTDKLRDLEEYAWELLLEDRWRL